MSTPNIAAADPRDFMDEDQSLESESSFVAVSSAIRRLLDQVTLVAPHLRIAALEGESGSGKNTLARVLYQGYATRHSAICRWGFNRWDARDWLLSQSDPKSLAGFIFLDRVDLLAVPGQAVLLDILKDLDFRPTGTLVVLASSESSLRELARNGQFLSGLSNRLTTVRLAIPPLRERKEDIIPLANVFLNRISARYHLPPVTLTSGAIARLLEQQWSGNLRELSSILETAVIECSNSVIRAEDLPVPASHAVAHHSTRLPELLNLDAVIYHHTLRVLELNDGNKLKTARQLGISRSTLYRLLTKRLSYTA
jgi:DNA-binding NtrC family response regulator